MSFDGRSVVDVQRLSSARAHGGTHVSPYLARREKPRTAISVGGGGAVGSLSSRRQQGALIAAASSFLRVESS